MLLEKVNRNPELAGRIDAAPACGNAVPIMATFSIVCPTTPAIAKGYAKAAGYAVGGGAVTGAAAVGYQAANK